MSKIENLNLSALLSQNINHNKNAKHDSGFKDIFSRASDKAPDRTLSNPKREIETKNSEPERKTLEKSPSNDNQNTKTVKEEQKDVVKGNENKEQTIKEDEASEKTDNKTEVKETISNEKVEPEDINQDKDIDIDSNLLETIAAILKSLNSDIEPINQMENEKINQIVQEIKNVLENNKELLSQIAKEDINPDKILKMLSEAGIDINKLIQNIQGSEKNILPKALSEGSIKIPKEKIESKGEHLNVRKELTLGNDLKAQILSLKVESLPQEKMMLSDEFSEDMMEFGFINNDSDDTLNISDIKFSSLGLKSTDSIGNTGIKDARPIQIINKIAQEIKSIIGKDKSEINIKLEPESLGKLSVKISSENGVFNASFYAENDKAKTMIESNIASLKKTLEEQGIQINELSVFVGSNPDDLNRHKSIMEAQKYSKLKNDGSIGIENEIEDLMAPLNPYMIDDMFSDLI
ncbi:flagellar hook-length control protein FliK [Acetoanaerobium pronyense]|uniref:Flagellar hook-length control protein FliK n=1 Tax=Acetoanaerobium pronyense TaxID=1482736 RepID=A0ABS4KGB4_9FIRM|nr:flagellar hook-length control protein FliK [Acetoanaerobium pronyense]MBP2026400.1 flagellar hook-length control protein FliK [Acetoanaerobium pronyense]